MKRRQAILKCWELVDNYKYAEAAALLKKQSRIHGRRLFNYQMRLSIVNGIWLQETGQERKTRRAARQEQAAGRPTGRRCPVRSNLRLQL